MVTIDEIKTQLAKLRKVTTLDIISRADHNDLVDLVSMVTTYIEALELSWDNIVGKPSEFPPENHLRSKVTDFFGSPFWGSIPDKPSVFPPDDHNHLRSEVTDLFDSPFWGSIPDKPSVFPPDDHLRSKVTDFFGSPFWDSIPDKPPLFLPYGDMSDQAVYNIKRMSTVPSAGDIGTDGLILYEAPEYGLTRGTDGKIDYEDFEDISDWTEDVTYFDGTLTLEAAIKKAGSYSGKIQALTTGTKYTAWYRFHTSQTGIYYIEFWVRCAQTNLYNQIGGDTNASTAWLISMGDDAHWRYRDSVGWKTLPIDTLYSANTWYKVRLKIDINTDTFDIWIDGVSKGTDLGFKITKTAIDRLWILSYNGCISYFDDLSLSKNNIITVNSLSTGQKFKVYDRLGNLVGTSSAANGSAATLTVDTYATDVQPYRNIIVTDTDGLTTFYTMPVDHAQYNSIYGGDVYSFTTTYIRRLYTNINGTVEYLTPV